MKNLIQNKIKELPDLPGVYMFLDKNGSILYIGKAGSLKRRVSSYFAKRRAGNVLPKISLMTTKIYNIDCIPLKSEEEALILEDRLVKEYQPKYNKELKDDKRYPLVKITVNEPWPGIHLVRRRKDDGARYFGPYTDAGALRRTLKFIRKSFKLKRCKPKNPADKDLKHCLYYHLGECLAPCIREVSPPEYQEVVKQVCLLLEGRADELVKKLNSKMRHASRHQNYERAVKYRDLISDLEKVIGTKVRKEILKGMVYVPGNVEKELKGLAEELNLGKPPVWIDAFDVSNIYGKEAVGSLVRFRNGLPYKNGYRRFKIKTVTGIDDYAMMKEIVFRRYKKAEYPDLILIDGGKGQLSAARDILPSNVKVAGLAKQYEEIYLPEKKNPLWLPKDSPALKLLMRIRDEAHRFAITYHRKLRRKGLKK